MICPADIKKQLLLSQPLNLDHLALELFNYQARHNSVYALYLRYRGVEVQKVTKISEIPFLPIEFFKTQEVKTGTFDSQVIYQSSGTTQQSRSRHYLPNDIFYKQNTQYIFEYFYGPVSDYVFLALLPSYLEQGDSSLVSMVAYLVQQSGQGIPGFYLHNYEVLLQNIERARLSGKKIMLIGVTYALLDLAETVTKNSLSDIIIMETGGMKGRRREMVRAELHGILQNAFGVEAIHSEYGMTELLSQAYSMGAGIFWAPPSLKILLRDMNDPLTLNENLTSGGINIIDLANVDSCAFIETKDIGKLHADGSFEVLGRFDNSDIRGCNLLAG